MKRWAFFLVLGAFLGLVGCGDDAAPSSDEADAIAGPDAAGDTQVPADAGVTADATTDGQGEPLEDSGGTTDALGPDSSAPEDTGAGGDSAGSDAATADTSGPLDGGGADIAGSEDTGNGADSEIVDVGVSEDSGTGGPDAESPAPQVVINEVSCNDSDWVELVNLDASVPVSVGGWLLTDDLDDLDSAYSLPAGTVIPAGGRLVVTKAQETTPGFAFGIKCLDEKITLLDPEQDEVDAAELEVTEPAATWGRLPDGQGGWTLTTPTPGAPNAAFVDPLEQMYSPFTLSKVDLFLTPEGIQKLFVDPYTYVPGRIRIQVGDVVHPTMEVGIRIKGRLGSFRQLTQKSAFRIKFNYVHPEQRFLGLKNATLNNMVQDSSMLHEAVFYRLARAFDVAVPRTGYAWVRLNNRDYGLYLNLESPDDVFLKQHHATTQHLYEGAYGTDVHPGNSGSFEVDEGDPTDRSDLEALATAADTTPGPEWMAAMAPVADLAQMCRVWALEVFTGHWDGYAPTINNYYFHSDDAGVFTMMPWGADQTFGAWLGWHEGNAKLFQRCLATAECKALYDKTMAEIAITAESLELDPFIVDLAAFLRPWADLDPRKPYGIWDVDGSVQGTREFVNNRTAAAKQSFGCLLSGNPDPDGDGYDCASDCDNGNPNVHPGLEDICGDDIDQDCNGAVDDSPGCPDWTEVFISGKRYLVSYTPRQYAAGVAHCAAAGSKPLILDSQNEAAALLQAVPNIGNGNFWLGLTDLVTEGDFRWWDGSAPTFTVWNGGEPNNWGGNEDCAEWLSGGPWNDLRCDDSRPIICEDACQPGPPVDADGDGFAACVSDCDDNDAGINPDATDTCFDGIDQDCTGTADDGDACPDNCTTVLAVGLKTAVCNTPSTWQEARNSCQQAGGDLAWFASSAENAAFQAQAQAKGATGERWIGLNDLGTEGSYMWSVGQTATWFNWTPGQPNNSGEQDCTRILGDGTWNDTACGLLYGYVCRFEMPLLPIADGDCEPDCEDKNCGDDGCGGSCGDCVSGQVCDAGACVAAPPSCEGFCGGQAAAGCYCDDLCVDYGDCCPDYASVCVTVPLSDSCEGACGGTAPSGCSCADGCEAAGTCCADFEALCAPPEPNSCEVSCGGQAPAGCWCDNQCTSFGDCCADYAEYCLGASGSCENGCNNVTSAGCFCDALCEVYHDCCDGYVENCAGGCSCEGLECGDDGCGNDCGTCDAGEVCDAFGACLPSQPGWGCTAAEAPGCGGCPCESCVCESDVFCCYIAWDTACAVACAEQCDAAGLCASP